jgi:hypothetical protein
MSSAWQEYKKKLGDSRPWHLLNSNNYVNDEIALSRYEICKLCPELIDLTKQCKQCGCIMTMKTKLINASCPLSKW